MHGNQPMRKFEIYLIIIKVRNGASYTGLFKGIWGREKEEVHEKISKIFPFNSSPPGHNDRHLADDILKRIFVNKRFCILIKIPPNFVPKGLIDNNPALV